MSIWTIKYTAHPTAYNHPQVARIEADTAEDAKQLLMDRLGECYDCWLPGQPHRLDENRYVHNYTICEPQPYVPPAAKGRILSMEGEPAASLPRCRDELQVGRDIHCCQLSAGHEGNHRNGQRMWN